MIYSNIKSNNKILHIDGCHHLNKCPSKIHTFALIKDALRKGYRLCKHCNPIAHLWNSEGEKAKKYAQKHQIRMIFTGMSIDIACGKEKWKVILNETGDGIALYHKNCTKAYTDNYVPQYHNQEVRFLSLRSYLRYIFRHNEYRKNNPLPQRQPKKAHSPNFKRKKPQKQNNEKILNLLQSLHKAEYYQDFLCYIQ